MKKRIMILIGVCLSAMLLYGCSGEISNDYVTVSDYKGIEVEKVDKVQVTDKEVETSINSMLEAEATYEDVTGRAAEEGDVANIDYVGKLDGVAFEGGTAEGAELILGSNSFIDGFEAGIVGHNIGETFDLNLTFPDPYKNNPDLAGKPVIFTVTLNGLSKQILPELTDELVQKYSETAKTVEEYKKELKEQMQKSYDSYAETTLKEAVWTELMENHVEISKYPKDELKSMNERIRKQYEQRAEAYDMDFEEYLESYLNMDEETFNTEQSKAAKSQVKANLVCELIAEKAKIDLSDEALETCYKKYAEDYGFESAEALKATMKEAGIEEDLKEMASMDLVKEWLAENCKQVDKKEEKSE